MGTPGWWPDITVDRPPFMWTQIAPVVPKPVRYFSEWGDFIRAHQFRVCVGRASRRWWLGGPDPNKGFDLVYRPVPKTITVAELRRRLDGLEGSTEVWMVYDDDGSGREDPVADARLYRLPYRIADPLVFAILLEPVRGNTDE